MTVTIKVEKDVTFDKKEYAGTLIDCLYDLLMYGEQGNDWDCLTEEQQTAIAEEVLTEAIRQVKKGER